jgi:hypothetical protein
LASKLPLKFSFAECCALRQGSFYPELGHLLCEVLFDLLQPMKKIGRVELDRTA